MSNIEIPYKLSVAVLMNEKNRSLTTSYYPVIFPIDAQKRKKKYKESLTSTLRRTEGELHKKLQEDDFEEVILNNTNFSIEIPETDRGIGKHFNLDSEPFRLYGFTGFKIYITNEEIRKTGWEKFTVFINFRDILNVISSAENINFRKVTGLFRVGSLYRDGRLDTLVLDNGNDSITSEVYMSRMLYEGKRTSKWVPGHKYLLPNKQEIIYFGKCYGLRYYNYRTFSTLTSLFNPPWGVNKYGLVHMFVDCEYFFDVFWSGYYNVSVKENEKLFSVFNKFKNIGSIDETDKYVDLPIGTRSLLIPAIDLGEVFKYDQNIDGNIEDFIEETCIRHIYTLLDNKSSLKKDKIDMYLGKIHPELILKDEKLLTYFKSRVVEKSTEEIKNYALYTRGIILQFLSTTHADILNFPEKFGLYTLGRLSKILTSVISSVGETIITDIMEQCKKLV